MRVGKASNAFALQIDRELAETMEEFELIVRRLALDGLTRIVQRTPVDTGRARGNWIVTVGERSMFAGAPVDPVGTRVISDGVAALNEFQAAETFPSIFIQNNLPYIERLEGGYSTQAPGGMVSITLTELKAQIS